MSKQLISAVKYTFLLLLAAFMLFFAFKGVSFNKLISNLLNADFRWILLSIVIAILSHISRAIRWNILLRPLGYKPALVDTFAAVMTGYLANYAFPRMGEVSRCGVLTKSDKIPFNVLIGTVITERVIDMITLLCILCLSIVVESSVIANFIKNNFVSPLLSRFTSFSNSPRSMVMVALVIGIIVLMIIYLIPRIKRKSGGKIKSLFGGIVKGMKSILTMPDKGLFIFHSILIWVLYYLMAYVCLFSLGATSHLGLGAGLLTLVAGSLAMAAPVQGGIGAYHILVSQGLLLFGILKEDGLAYATLVHSIQTLVVLVIGALSFLFIALKKSRYATA